MIIYHPAYDAHHCCYRILNILNSIGRNKISKDMLKLIDFYYIYPHLLKKIEKLPRPLSSYANVIKNINEPFEITPNPRSLFFELGQTQEYSIKSLKNKKLITYENSVLTLNKKLVPQTLLEKFKKDTFTKTETFKILTDALPKVNLSGKNGFKARSGLMEYRYE